MNIRQAVKTYNIPKSTLIDTMRDRYQNPGNLGGPTVLLENEEKHLVTWIAEMGQLGFPVTKSQLVDSVQS